MSDTPWTPGPWRAEPPQDGGRVLAGDERATIIHIPPGSPYHPTCIADGHLIAASPTMFKALSECADYLQELLDDNGGCSWDHSERHCATPCAAFGCMKARIDMARAALAKARGET